MEKIIKQYNEHTTLIYHDVYQKLCIKKTLNEQSLHYYNELRHYQIPRVPQVLELTSTFVLLQYFEGITLDEYIAINGPLTKEFLCTMVSALCESLAALHANNFVHRDIKPQNIIITEQKTIYLIDLDAVRKVTNNKSQDTELLGTRGYASPEHYGFKETDNRSDIYSLGVVIEACSQNTDYAELFMPVITKSTAIDPANRYQNIESLAADMKKIADQIALEEARKKHELEKKEQDIITHAHMAQSSIPPIMPTTTVPTYDKVLTVIAYVIIGLLSLFALTLLIFGYFIDENTYSLFEMLMITGMLVAFVALIPAVFLLLATIILKLAKKQTTLLRLLLICGGAFIGSSLFVIFIAILSVIFER